VLRDTAMWRTAFLAACGRGGGSGPGLDWHGMIWVEEIERWISV